MDDITGLAARLAAAPSLPQLYGLLDEAQMKNGWAKPTPSIYPEPKQHFVGASWRYSQAHAALEAAGRLVDTQWAERRNLILANPVPGNDYATVTTLVAAYQMVKAGETARSHRHTPNAMRVVLDAAPGLYTIVSGKRVPMLRGDVLLTPNWLFHGHANDSSADAYWIDILDSPTVQLLGPMFFEHHPDRVEHAPVIDAASPMRFAYADYYPKLMAQAEDAPGVRRLELGPPYLETFDRVAVSVARASAWDCARSTVNHIVVVIEGTGTSTVGDRRFDWSAGDVMAVPAWQEHHHEASTDTLLLSVSDRPLLEKLKWIRTG